jgi:uncharacterized protein
MARMHPMAQPIRPSTVLPAIRTAFTVTTADGINLVGEVSAPTQTGPSPMLLTLHPNPAGGGMMDSHIFQEGGESIAGHGWYHSRSL